MTRCSVANACIRSALLQARIRRILRRPYRVARSGMSLAQLPYTIVRPRRIDVCCCGLSKSGTHSMAGIFADYRSAHHPDERYRLRLATAYLTGGVDVAAAERLLQRRDRFLRLEMESSSLAGILVEPLARAFPERRFVLTIRDVFSWSDSWFDHNLNEPADPSAPWSVLDRTRLRAEGARPTRHDAPLSERGFPPLECFFRLWADHNERVLWAVEPSRLLVVRTNEITERIPQIADWVGVPTDTLRSERSWLYQSRRKHHLLSRLDASYVRDTAERISSDLMNRYFPDVSWEPTT
jgi:hypothetical protein